MEKQTSFTFFTVAYYFTIPIFYQNSTIVCRYGVKYLIQTWIKYGGSKNEQLRIIFNKPYDEPTQDLFKQLRCHNIYERYFYQCCIEVFKLNKIENSPLSHLINLQSHSSSCNLRSNSNHLILQVPFPHKEIFKQSFLYSAAISWNSLPNSIRSSPFINCSKRLCHHYVLTNLM